MKSFRWLLTLFVVLISSSVAAGDTLFLRDNLQKARPGDYLVIASNKTQTLMHIYDKRAQFLTIEEVVVPENKRLSSPLGWKEWVQQNAPGHTSWVIYEIDTTNGQMTRYYSFTKNGWFEIPDSDNFLSKLLNLRFIKMPEKACKRVGPKPTSGPDWRPLWQPRMVVEGKKIDGVQFDGWRTRWPKDNTDLSGRMIEVFLPKDNQQFASYFPYWLQVSGIAGKAKIRIIDSGSSLKSSKPSLSTLSHPTVTY